MVPGSWPYGVPPSSLGFGSYANGPNPFAIPSAPAYAFAPPLYGLDWPVYPPGYYYQAQTSSAPPTYGGLIWNGGFPSTTYPASTFPNQTRSASSGLTFPAPIYPQASSTSAGTAHWGSSTSNTSPTFTFPSQPQASSSSTETTFWGNSPQSTVPTFASPSLPQASSSSIGSTSRSIPQASSSATGTTFWDSIRSAVKPTFTFPSQTQAPTTTPPLFGGPQTTPSSGPSTTSFPPRGSRVAPYAPTHDDSGYSGYYFSISAMPIYQNKSHEELRLEDYQTLSDKGLQANPPFVASTVGFLPQGGAVFSDVPASNNEKFISISATPAYSNKSHEELRLEHYNALRPIQPHLSSATSNGLGTLCSCGSLLQKQKSAGAETLVNLLTSALSTNTFPIGIGLAGQFSPDTPVLCQLQSSSSARPTGAATSSTQTSSFTAFTWPELGRKTAPQSTQNAPETLASTDKISGQSTEGTFKSGVPSTSLFGVPFTFPPPAAPTDPRKTQNAPETLASTDKISGQSTEGAFKSGIPSTSLFGVPFTFPPSAAPTDPRKTQNAPETLASTDKISGQSTEGIYMKLASTSPFGVPFTFPPSTAPTVHHKTQNATDTLASTDKISGQSTEGAFKSGIALPSSSGVTFTFPPPFTFPPSPSPTSQCGVSSIPTLNNSAPIKTASLHSARSLTSGLHGRCGKVPFYEKRICEATTSLNRTQNTKARVLNSMGDESLETKLCNLSFLQQKSSKSETVGNSEGSSAKLKLNISVPLDDFEADEVSTHDVEAMMPKIRSLDYYTVPAIHELAEKERIEPGFCSRVKDFVVGRRDYGCIKFLGETDVRNLDLESLIKFDTRELTLLESDGEKAETGQCLNKPSEVTLLNVKCMDKSTGIQCVDGPKVDKFRQMLIRKAAAAGVEFMSYEPAAGEWKFRVQHF